MIKPLEQPTKNLVLDAEAATKILHMAVGETSHRGKTLLQGAFSYVYAAMLADIARLVEKEIPFVRKELGVVNGSEFLIDHLFQQTLKPLFRDEISMEYLYDVKRKATAIIDARRSA